LLFLFTPLGRFLWQQVEYQFCSPTTFNYRFSISRSLYKAHYLNYRLDSHLYKLFLYIFILQLFFYILLVL
jgi:hypothetical protein